MSTVEVPVPSREIARAIVKITLDDLAESCADGPLVDLDRGIVVHRIDRELAEFLSEWADEIDVNDHILRTHVNNLRHAADLIDGGQ